MDMSLSSLMSINSLTSSAMAVPIASCPTKLQFVGHRVVVSRDHKLRNADFGMRISESRLRIGQSAIRNLHSAIRRVISFQMRFAPLWVTAEYATKSFVSKTADARLSLALN